MVRRVSTSKNNRPWWRRWRRQQRPAAPPSTQHDYSIVAPTNPPTVPQQRQKLRTAQLVRPVPEYVYLVRLIISLLGFGTLGGTILSIIQPPLPTATKTTPPAVRSNPTPVVVTNSENMALQSKLQQLATRYPQLKLHLSVLNLTKKEMVNLQETTIIPAAGTIKIPILVALFQQIDRQQLQLNEKLVLEKSMIAGGNGEMANQPVGSKFTVLDTATKMIVNNDNTATNLLIKRLGGQDQLNTQFRSWGLAQTMLKNPLPDFAGTNVTTAKELTDLWQRLEQKTLLSPKAQQQVMVLLSKAKTNRQIMLPWGLTPTPTVAHKTGDIADLVADTGLIELPGQQKYVVSAMVVRNGNDTQAVELIRQVSKIVHQEYTSPAVSSTASPTAAPATPALSR